ncbi:hypothetical protein NliqN6_4445 [Naganishia liquefaciens]|uniref:DUF1264-domain-containing protein n=1 Tax=Naganishia liquefaciens TaxID=104408 RepID=A0A8H3YG90_9TREE|nr:hypothetical protein NliqN6_4445 [Naganishia liquefaciens]
MDPSVETVKSVYQSTPYQAAGAALMSFQPLSNIKQHLCGLHTYAHDPSRSVIAHHYCTHLHGKNMHQCLIFDSDTPGARLIGIEYVIPEETFVALPDEEKKYWHSHKFEVESGMLQLGMKPLVPNAVADTAEIPAMTELQTTYGKTTHTWQYDIHPDFPMGPPQLMMAYTADDHVDEALLASRDAQAGTSTAAKRQHRKTYLPQSAIDKMPAEGADAWLSGRTVQFEPVERDVEPIPKGVRSKIGGEKEEA